jgi:hypothetical protein
MLRAAFAAHAQCCRFFVDAPAQYAAGQRIGVAGQLDRLVQHLVALLAHRLAHGDGQLFAPGVVGFARCQVFALGNFERQVGHFLGLGIGVRFACVVRGAGHRTLVFWHV